MDRTRMLARSLLFSTAAVMATSLVLATAPATRGGADAGTAVQKRLPGRLSEAGRRQAPADAVPELLAKAAPDECFVGLGPPASAEVAGAGCELGQPKVNQSYVWGLTRSGNSLWFGTAPNAHCLTMGLSLALTEPIQNDDYVCEYGESPVRAEMPIIPPAGGDWRPPKLYAYDTSSRTLTDKTEDVRTASELDRQRLESTVGIRAAGSHRGVVLLGGPSVLGLNLFAFDGESGRYLGSTTLPEYGSIRHFLVADSALYAGVGLGTDGQSGGAVLRWTGSRSSPFDFTVVGSLPAQVADLVVHKGRMFVTTWPSVNRAVEGGNTAGLWMSPWLADGERGLNLEDATAWTQVWNVTQYEPDPVIATTYGLGGLASYGGNLYWGTMHVPMKALSVHASVYEPVGAEQEAAVAQNTHRATSIFRASRFDQGRAQADLLYGAAELPAYDPEANDGKGAWRLVPTGYKPRYGAAGFGNGYNNYTWKMAVVGDALYIGTMDWSYLAKDLPADLRAATQAALGVIAPASYGADLWVFDQPHGPARPVDTTGLGNYLNYGIRSMVADRSTLYVGTANPMNLRTDPGDDVPEGGWELIRLPVAGS